jgi:hypothetical protein
MMDCTPAPQHEQRCPHPHPQSHLPLPHLPSHPPPSSLPCPTPLLQPPGLMLQGNPELEAVWRLLQYCWAQQYEGIWSALQGYAWTPQASGSSSRSSSRAGHASTGMLGGQPARLQLGGGAWA